MDRLDLLDPDMPSQAPKNSIKQSAYFEYLKSFSEEGLETLQKLERQFQFESEDGGKLEQNDLDEKRIFKRIKTLISSYEVFVLQINDTCEFVEAPQFGECLLRVFIQIIGILKWSLEVIAKKEKIMTESLQIHSNLPSVLNDPHYTRAIYQRQSTLVSMSNKYQMESELRNTFNESQKPSNLPMSQNIRQSVHKQQEVKQPNNICQECRNRADLTEKIQRSKNLFKAKQMVGVELKDIGEQIKRIQHEYKEEELKRQKQNEEKRRINKFLQNRENSQNSDFTDASKNQEILGEILFSLSKKGEAMSRFAELRLCAIQENGTLAKGSKENSKGTNTYEESYEQMKSEFLQEVSKKVAEAKARLSETFKDHVLKYEKQKQLRGIDFGCQLYEEDLIDSNEKTGKIYQIRMIKKLKGDIKLLEREIELERQQNEGLKRLLHSKSIEYEGEMMKYRNDYITLESKTKKQLQSYRQLLSKDSENNRNRFRGGGSDADKGDLSIELIEEPRQSVERQSGGSTCSPVSRITGLIDARRTEKFRHKTNQRITCNLEPSFKIYCTVSDLIFPTPGCPLDSPKKFKKIVDLEHSERPRQTMVDCMVQTVDTEQNSRTKMSLLNQEKRVSEFLNRQAIGTFSSQVRASRLSPSRFARDRKSMLSYMKKRSSHMGEMAKHFQIIRDGQTGGDSALANISKWDNGSEENLNSMNGEESFNIYNHPENQESIQRRIDESTIQQQAAQVTKHQTTGKIQKSSKQWMPSQINRNSSPYKKVGSRHIQKFKRAIPEAKFQQRQSKENLLYFCDKSRANEIITLGTHTQRRTLFSAQKNRSKNREFSDLNNFDEQKSNKLQRSTKLQRKSRLKTAKEYDSNRRNNFEVLLSNNETSRNS